MHLGTYFNFQLHELHHIKKIFNLPSKDFQRIGGTFDEVQSCHSLLMRLTKVLKNTNSILR